MLYIFETFLHHCINCEKKSARSAAKFSYYLQNRRSSDISFGVVKYNNSNSCIGTWPSNIHVNCMQACRLYAQNIMIIIIIF